MEIKLYKTLIFSFLVYTSFGKKYRTHIFRTGQKINSVPIPSMTGGKFVSVENYTFVASIVLLYQHYTRHMCGATIIADFWSVTAAHCLDFEMMQRVAMHGKLVIRAGTTFIRGSAGYDHHVAGYKVHEKFNTDVTFDIALIKVKEPFNNPMEQPIEVTAPSNYLYQIGSRAKVLGWGLTVVNGVASERLKFSEVTLITNQECQNAYGGKGRRIFMNNRALCTLTSDTDICQGDPGGPLFQANVLVGIIATGAPCANFSFPQIYVRISEFDDWMQKWKQKNLNIELNTE